MYDSNNENISIEAVDNGFIVRMFIPVNYPDPNFAAVDRMADRIIELKGKIEGEEWKEKTEEQHIEIPLEKSHYTFVCKDQKEVLEKISEFFQRVK